MCESRHWCVRGHDGTDTILAEICAFNSNLCRSPTAPTLPARCRRRVQSKGESSEKNRNLLRVSNLGNLQPDAVKIPGNVRCFLPSSSRIVLPGFAACLQTLRCLRSILLTPPSQAAECPSGASWNLMASLMEPNETLIRLYTQRISRKQFDNHTYLRGTKRDALPEEELCGQPVGSCVLRFSPRSLVPSPRRRRSLGP